MGLMEPWDVLLLDEVRVHIALHLSAAHPKSRSP
jgi:hypothetical protein